MRTLQLRRACHTASGQQKAEWGADLGSSVWMANPDPLTPPCLTPPRDAHPRESSETHALGKAWTPLTSPPRAHYSCCPRWMGPRAPSEPSSEAGRMRREGILRNRKNSNTDRRVSEACPWVRSPAKAPTSGQYQPSVCLGGWALDRSSRDLLQAQHIFKKQHPRIDHMHQGQGSSHPGPVPTWPPSHHAAAPWGLFPVGMSRVGEGQ